MLPLSNQQITNAFEVMCSANGTGGAEIKWSKLKETLIAEGESIAPDNLEDFLVSLLGEAKTLLSDDSYFDPRSFAEEVLGFSE